MIRKNCLICNLPFDARNDNEKYCKREHKIKCNVCGKIIELKTNLQKSHYFKQGFITCSQKCAKINMVNTNKDKYGYSSPFQRQDIKDKIKEIQQTKEYKQKLSKSVSKARLNFSKQKMEEVNSKIQQTNIEKYGVKCCLTLPKSRKTMLQKYGVEYTGQSKELLQKMQNTNRIKYGTNYPISNYSYLGDEIHNILDSKNNLLQFIESVKFEYRTQELVANSLGISVSYLSNLLNKYDINKYMNHFSSTLELNVRQFLDTLDVEYETNVRTIIYPYELDIYLPKHKLAIECNGTYYHSNKNGVDKNYHYNKSKLCEEKGIRLIHIFEYEWENERQRPILENIIKNALNLNTTLYARKLKIKILPSAETKTFFNANNIQGFRGGKFAICLVYNDEIVMSYMMGKAFFGKGKYEWEVIRGATKLGYNVVGGASKIFKYFINNYKPKNCVYYIDYNYFNGNSLKNLPNMKFIKTQPSFKNYWIKERRVKNREPQRNAEIKELYKTGEVLQIYNAGTKVYVWENN